MVDYLTVLDLFSGPGGLSEGIKQARNHNFRFKVVVANDYNQDVNETYTKNHSGVDFILGSITDDAIKNKIVSSIKKQTNRTTVDLVIGGPPCKGFSLENKVTRNMKNPLNYLVRHYVDMIKRTNPVAFIMENVPGIFAMEDGKIVESLISEFKTLGYSNSTSWLLNAADYGSPQLRKRAFIVGSKSQVPIIRPEKTHGNDEEIKQNPKLSPHITLADVLGDLPKIPAGRTEPKTNEYALEPQNKFQKNIRAKSGKITDHIVTKNTPIVIERIKAVPSGGNWKDIPVELMKINGKYQRLELAHSMIYKRLLKNKPSVTITNFRKAMLIHPVQHRLLSVREAARIQTFPDSFEFKGSLGNKQQQVSDAVPVQLAKAVGEAMLIHLHDVIKVVVT